MKSTDAARLERGSFRLEWTDSKGAWHCETSRYVGRFWEKLKKIRCNAQLWTLDANGVKIEIVGGCEPATEADDKRLKWNWWYDSTIA